MKAYRRIILIASFVVAVGVYALLYALAPDILLMSASAAPQRMPEPLKVMLYNGPMPEPTPPEDVITTALASRPGSVRDLIRDETAELPLEPPPRSPLEGPAEAAAPPAPRAEALVREHDLARNDSLLGGMEARLVAIPEESARANIEIARRFVPENDTRILATDNMPALVDNTGGPPAFSLPADRSAPQAPAQSQASEAARVAPEMPSLGLLDPPQDRSSPSVPGLEDETVLARETVVQEVRGNSQFDAMEGLVRVETTTYVDPATRDGYFRLRIIPRDDADIAPLPRDVTFVVDASNSIVQRKLDLTVRGLLSCLASLRPEDLFNVVVFRDTPRPFRAAPVPANPENLAEAKKFLTGIESGGSTDVYGAVQPVLLDPPREGGPGIVMVLSDGRPTTGNLEGRDLIRGLSEHNRAGNTVYTFGGGNTVNRYLMDLLAYRNRGQSFIADDIEEVDDELPKFFRRVQDALLVDLHADYGSVDENSVFPQALPDFYRGRVVTVYGKYRPGQDDDLTLRLQGRAGGQRKEIVLKTDLAGAEKGTREVAEGWAFEKTYHLIGEITEVGETPEIMDEIHRLSDDFGVRTSYSP